MSTLKRCQVLIQMFDWNRTYPSVAQWHPIYGRVSTYEQGIPATSSGYYLAHDYQSNDRVGLSQLEILL